MRLLRRGRDAKCPPPPTLRTGEENFVVQSLAAYTGGLKKKLVKPAKLLRKVAFRHHRVLVESRLLHG